MLGPWLRICKPFDVYALQAGKFMTFDKLQS
jgi:hypothetical protein